MEINEGVYGFQNIMSYLATNYAETIMTVAFSFHKVQCNGKKFKRDFSMLLKTYVMFCTFALSFDRNFFLIVALISKLVPAMF